MSLKLLQTLIDKTDNFEIIRDQIALIIKCESANQMTLATPAGKDPKDFDLKVFTERSNPWEQFLNDQTDRTPLINVWFDRSVIDGKASNVVERQTIDGVFNIDCIGFGISQDIPAGGHTPGDQDAALQAHRAIRLVRNILMSDTNTYLQLRGVVGRRWAETITSFQVPMEAKSIQKISGARIALSVRFNEFSPQFVPETLEFLAVDVKRAENGEILVETDYDYNIIIP